MSINIYHNGELVPVTGGGGSGDGSTVKTTTAATGSGSIVATTIASNTSVDDIAGIVANNSYALNASLAGKQNSADNSLATSDKTVVGAINEINTGLGNINFTGVNFNSGNYTGDVDCNNTTENGVYYYNVNGPSTSIGASNRDGALIVQNYNSSWVSQIAIDYRNGSIFSRGKNNGTWTDWVKMQNSTDNNLNTTSKNVVGAINELNTNFSNALANLKNTQVAEWSRAKNESTFTNFINKLALYQNTNWHDTIGNLTGGGDWGFKLVQNNGCTIEDGGFTTSSDTYSGIVVENTYGARCLIYFTVTKATSTGSVAQCGAGTNAGTLPTLMSTGANRTQFRDGLSFIVSVPAGYRAYICGANIRITGASWFPIEQDQTNTYSVIRTGTIDMGSTNSFRYINVNTRMYSSNISIPDLYCYSSGSCWATFIISAACFNPHSDYAETGYVYNTSRTADGITGNTMTLEYDYIFGYNILPIRISFVVTSSANRVNNITITKIELKRNSYNDFRVRGCLIGEHMSGSSGSGISEDIPLTVIPVDTNRAYMTIWSGSAEACVKLASHAPYLHLIAEIGNW